jgi:hypothetical protein
VFCVFAKAADSDFQVLIASRYFKLKLDPGWCSVLVANALARGLLGHVTSGVSDHQVDLVLILEVGPDTDDFALESNTGQQRCPFDREFCHLFVEIV